MIVAPLAAARSRLPAWTARPICSHALMLAPAIRTRATASHAKDEDCVAAHQKFRLTSMSVTMDGADTSLARSVAVPKAVRVTV